MPPSSVLKPATNRQYVALGLVGAAALTAGAVAMYFLGPLLWSATPAAEPAHAENTHAEPRRAVGEQAEEGIVVLPQEQWKAADLWLAPTTVMDLPQAKWATEATEAAA